MKHTFYVFPAGLTGAGLLLVRVSVVLPLLTLTLPLSRHPILTWQALGMVFLAVALSIGFCTRMTASLAVGITALQILSIGATLQMPVLAHMLNAAALAMVGPGAFSIDAKLFGRQILHIPQ